MAKHADPADRQLSGPPGADDSSALEPEESSAAEAEPSRTEAIETGECGDDGTKPPGLKRLSSLRSAIAIAAAIVVALAALAGWLGYRTYETRQAQAQRNQWIVVARQGALNLTTIDYTQVDADVQRILDSATGAFRDDFQKRSQPFAEVVKKAQSKSQGAITEAGLESQQSDQAQVLVAVSVKTSSAGAPEQDTRRWRMRIGVQKVGDAVKVSVVEFVP
ncbi:Mce protein [Mycobacterium paraintracellulare]|uniref:Mce protein n=1 Tax=Mycobacterium paraintracellulare TaxID=1138383 RepID=UPI001928CA9D|nr:Mce protein [Mycobacterium paraintracellulare]BCP14132.1 Mce associated membrane protein [Mycobacterium paraintracellulare]